VSALRLQDDSLFDGWHSFDARAVLAVTLGHRDHNPSVDYIAACLGIKQVAVIAAQR
jgi:hypothetical protein